VRRPGSVAPLAFGAALSLISVFVALLTHTAAAGEDGGLCTYRTYVWNVNAGRALRFETVSHPYRATKAEERDPVTGCTVCSEDQETVSLPPLAPFQICRKIAPAVRESLRALLDKGETIHEVTGYRVGKTRGGVDANGNRTLFSNHSFGIAIDVNERQNGLYDNCPVFGPRCRLVRGGAWRPGVRGTLTAHSAVVTALKQAGLRWGGEIDGNLKDFMHFSPTGY
jgi:hypothetical protein